MLQTNFKRFLANHKDHGETISRLEWAQSSLAWSHQELRDSYDKIRIREKKRDIFFSHMWKGVERGEGLVEIFEAHR